MLTYKNANNKNNSNNYIVLPFRADSIQAPVGFGERHLTAAGCLL